MQETFKLIQEHTETKVKHIEQLTQIRKLMIQFEFNTLNKKEFITQLDKLTKFEI